MLKSGAEEIVKTYKRDTEPWVIEQKDAHIEALAVQYKDNGEIMPNSRWLRRHRGDTEIARSLLDRGVDIERTAATLQRGQIWARFVQNYQIRDRMPLRTSKAERTEYEYWIDHQNDGEFLQYLRDNGVDVKRTLDVLKQEKNFSVYFDFVQRQRRLPKDPRGNGTAFKKMRRMSELDAEEKQESFLARWQYNVLNGKIKCLPVWIYRAVLYWVAFYNRRDNR